MMSVPATLMGGNVVLCVSLPWHGAGNGSSLVALCHLPLQEVGLFKPISLFSLYSLYSVNPRFGRSGEIWQVELFAPSHHPRLLQPILQLLWVALQQKVQPQPELCAGRAQNFGLAKSWRSSVHSQRLLGISEWRVKILSSSCILISL